MKKYFLTLILVLASVVTVLAATSYGIGNPYSITPTSDADLYMNTANGSIWRANSTTKGDWTKLLPVIADGSASAPFDLITAVDADVTDLNVDKIVVDIDTVAITAASAPATLDASVLNVSTTAAGDILTVADGVNGQMLTIFYHAQALATNTLVITPAHLASGTTITMSNLTERALMMFNGTEWYVVYTNGTVK